MINSLKNYIFELPGLRTIYALIDISNSNSINYMFYKINNLISISFTDKFDTSNIEYMSSTFSFCTSLIDINLKVFKTNNTKDRNKVIEFVKNAKSK